MGSNLGICKQRTYLGNVTAAEDVAQHLTAIHEHVSIGIYLTLVTTTIDFLQTYVRSSSFH